MESIRNAVFTACLCATLCAAVQMAAAERMKRELRLICGLVLVICIAVQLSGEDMKLDLTPRELAKSREYQSLDENYRQLVLSSTQEAIAESVRQELHKQGILPVEVVIVCTLDEYNSVEAASAEIYLAAGAAEHEQAAAKSIAQQLLPQTDIEVKTDDEQA